MRYFWSAAVALDPNAGELDAGQHFPLCKPEPLRRLFQVAGLQEIEVQPIEVPIHFRDFNDYWSPFLGGQGPAPDYAMSLCEEHRERLRERLRATLPTAPDGLIRLLARAWAGRGDDRIVITLSHQFLRQGAGGTQSMEKCQEILMGSGTAGEATSGDSFTPSHRSAQA